VDLRILARRVTERLGELAQLAPKAREAEVVRLRAVATEQRANERAAERERTVDQLLDGERRERVRCALSDGAARAEDERKVRRSPDVAGEWRGREAYADERPACVGAHMHRQPALPRVERASSELGQALGEEERMSLAEIDDAPA